MSFDPDSYLATSPGSTPKPATGGFDPDAYLAGAAGGFNPDAWLEANSPGPLGGIVNAGRRAGHQALAGLDVLGAMNRGTKRDDYLRQADELEKKAAEIDQLAPTWAPENRQKWADSARKTATQLRTRAQAMDTSATEQLAGAAEQQKKAAAIPLSEDYRKYGEAEGWEAAKLFLQNPVEFPLTIAVEGAVGSVPALAAGAAGAAAAGVPGLAAGAGLGSFATEYAGSILDTFAEAKIDTTNTDALKQAFADTELMDRARKRALARGVPVAVFDAFSGGIAGRTVRPVVKEGTKAIVKAGAKETAEQALLGMGGEVYGQMADQLADKGTIDDIDWKAVAAEGIGEVVPGAGEVAIGTARRTQNADGRTQDQTGKTQDLEERETRKTAPESSTSRVLPSSSTSLAEQMAAELPDAESRDVLAGRSTEAEARRLKGATVDFGQTVQTVLDTLLARNATPAQLDALDFQLRALAERAGKRTRLKPEAVNTSLANTFLMEALPAAEVFPLVAKLAENTANITALREGLARMRGKESAGAPAATAEATRGPDIATGATQPTGAAGSLSAEERAAKVEELKARERAAEEARQRAEQERAAQQQAALAAEKAARARRKEETQRLAQLEATGRDPDTGRIADLTAVPDDELAQLDPAKEGLTAEQIDREMERRMREAEREAALAPDRSQTDWAEFLRRNPLPRTDKVLQGELDQLAEAMTPRQKMEYFRKDRTGDLDGHAESARADYGFAEVMTPADVIEHTRRMLAGERIISQNRGEDDIRFARRGAPDAQAELVLDDVNLPAGASGLQRSLALAGKWWNRLHERVTTDRDPILLQIYARTGQQLQAAMERSAPLTEQELVEVVNAVGVDTAAAAIILRAQQQRLGWKAMGLIFQNGTIRGGSAGELVADRKTMGDFGPLRAIVESDETTTPEGEQRIARSPVRDENAELSAYELRGATRNELKLALWNSPQVVLQWPRGPREMPARALVNEALGAPKLKFVATMREAAARTLHEATGLTPEAFWTAVKMGDAALVNQLAARPNKLRERYRKAGRFVGPIAMQGTAPAATTTPFAQQESLPFARRPERMPAQQRETQQVAWWENFRLMAPGVAREVELRFGEPQALVAAGLARPEELTGEEEAVYYPVRGEQVRGILHLFDRALRTNPDDITRLNLLHEIGHAFYDLLDPETKTVLAGLWRHEIKSSTGPLFDPEGRLRQNVALRVETEIQEWFAERMAHANDAWAKRRLDASRTRGDTLIATLAARLRALLLRLREYLEAAFGRNGYNEQLISDFRAFLDQGERWNEGMEETDAPLTDAEPVPVAARREPLPQTETAPFKRWFGASKVTDATGQPLRVYHGARRADRIGNIFRSARATSGPMAFFTSDPAIASNYAEGKQDTSLEQPSDYAGWFKFKGRGMRSAVPIDSAWWNLTPQQRATALQRLFTTGYENPGEATGPIVPDSDSIMGRDSIEYELRQARGNVLRAAVEIWLNSGALFNDEERFLEVLQALGLEPATVEYDNPWQARSGVFPVYLSIQNPLNTAAIPPEVVAALDEAGKRKRAKQPAGGNHDAWDKNTISGRDWLETLHLDLANKTTQAWTRIPDWVTETLRAMGYDGIQDTGGKMGGTEHAVWVPFDETQVKSATGNRGTFDPEDRRIDWARRENPEAGRTPEQLLRDYASLERTRDRYLDEGDRVPRHVLTGLADLREALEESLPGWRDRLRERAENQTAAVAPGPEPEAGATALFEQESGISPDATAAKRSQLEASTLRRPSGMREWLASLARLLTGFKSSIPELPGGADGRTFARFRQGFRLLKAATEFVRKDAEERVAHVLEPLANLGASAVSAAQYRELQQLQRTREEQLAAGEVNPALKARIAELESALESVPYHLFRKVVLYRDLFFRSRLTGPDGEPLTLPFSLTAGEVETTLQELHQRLGASPHREAIEESLRRHYALIKDVRDGLLRRGYVIPEELRNPLYFPHLVLERTNPRLQRVKLDTAADFRGYLQQLVGSDRAIETDYLQAMYLHLATVEAHNARQDMIEQYWQPYDIRAQLEQEAKELSEQNAEQGRGPIDWRALVPADHVVMTVDNSIPLRPETIIDRQVLADRLGVALGEGDLQAQLRALGLSVTLTADDFRTALAAGQRPQWVVPKPVAEAMRGIRARETRTASTVEKVISAPQALWKRWTLFAPHTVIRYTYGNLVSDIEKLFSADPAVFGQLLPAWREVRAFYQGADPSPDLKEAFRRGVLDAVTAGEVTDLAAQQLDRFEAFLTSRERFETMLKAGLGWGVTVNRTREAAFRYAKFRADLARMRDGRDPVFAGAYHRDVRAITEATPEATHYAQAAEISRRTFGDYADISVNGDALRRLLMPFYSWTEVNFRYHVNLFRNLADMTAGAGAAQIARQTAAAASRVLVARSVTGVLLRLALPYVAAQLWNNSDDREEIEKELSDEDRRRFHLIIGRDEKGKAIVVYAPTALSDFLRWFGGNDFARLAAEYTRGDITFPQLAHEWVSNLPGDLINNVVQGVGPVYKAAWTAMFRRQTFPDVLDQRSIPDHDVTWAVLGNMVDGASVDYLRRLADRDYYSARTGKEWLQQLVLQARRRDPESWGYAATMDRVEAYKKAHGGTSEIGVNNRADAQLLASFRRAIRAGDVAAATGFYQRLLTAGYTQERFRASIDAGDPLATLKREVRRDFVAQLSPAEQHDLRNAYRFATRLKDFEPKERLLFPSQRATPAYRQRFAASGGRPDVLAQVMATTAARSEDERELRAEQLLQQAIRRHR